MTHFNCEDSKIDYKIHVEKQCIISNKDPKKNNNTDNTLSYALSTGQTVNKSKLSKTQYKILEALAGANDCDANDDVDVLTLRDMIHAKERFKTDNDVFRELDVKEFRCHASAGVANITANNGEVLRIEFGLNNKPAELKPAKTTPKAASSASSKTSDSTKTTSAKTSDKYEGIPKSWMPHVKNTAKKYGYTEDLILSIALSEGYTAVAEHKNEGSKGGLNEVGFGHTTKANRNNKFRAGFKISLKQAFDWLGQDIKDKEEKIIKNFGHYYDYKNLPQPLKEMMIDVAFNRGEGKLNPNLKLTAEEKKMGKKQIYDDNYDHAIANIKNENWGSAAVRFRQEEFSNSIKKQGKEGGLRKRNVQRFLRLMNDDKYRLHPEKIVGAMDLFNREYYYTKTLSLLNKTEADTLRQQWNNIYYLAKAKCVKQ